MSFDFDRFKHSSMLNQAGIDRSHGFDFDDTIVVSADLSSSCIENDPWNQSGGSLIYSQTLTFQNTLTVNSSANDDFDISGIGADVDGSDKGVDGLETGANNLSDGEFDVLPTSLTHPAKEKDKSCGDIKAASTAYDNDDSSLPPAFKDLWGSHDSFASQHHVDYTHMALRRSIDATAKEEENPETVEAPERVEDDHDKFSAESLLFAENYIRNAPFPPMLN